MEEIKLMRDGKRDLEFEGCQLSHASTYANGAPRWFELTLYRTRAGKYIAAGVGRSDVEGETDRYWARVASDPEDLVHVLERDEMKCEECGNSGKKHGKCPRCGSTDFRRTGARYLSRTAQIALDLAAHEDDAIDAAMVETVE